MTREKITGIANLLGIELPPVKEGTNAYGVWCDLVGTSYKRSVELEEVEGSDNDRVKPARDRLDSAIAEANLYVEQIEGKRT